MSHRPRRLACLEHLGNRVQLDLDPEVTDRLLRLDKRTPDIMISDESGFEGKTLDPSNTSAAGTPNPEPESRCSPIPQTPVRAAAQKPTNRVHGPTKNATIRREKYTNSNTHMAAWSEQKVYNSSRPMIQHDQLARLYFARIRHQANQMHNSRGHDPGIAKTSQKQSGPKPMGIPGCDNS